MKKGALIIVWAFCLFGSGLFAFMTGLHNIDLAFNFSRFFNVDELFDTTVAGKTISLIDGYIAGMALMMMSVMFFVASGVALGAAITNPQYFK